jgi:hypothetical protein
MNDIRKIRVLLGVVLVLAVAVIWEGAAISMLRADLQEAGRIEESLRKDVNAHAEALAAAVVDRRRPEVMDAGTWLHAFYQSDEGFRRAGGLCPDGEPDFDAISRWLLNVYLRERFAGTGDAAARRKVVEEIQKTEGWKESQTSEGKSQK